MHLKISKQLIAIIVFIISLLPISCTVAIKGVDVSFLKKPIDDTALTVIFVNDPIVYDVGNCEPEFGIGNKQALIANYLRGKFVEDFKRLSFIQNIKLDSNLYEGPECVKPSEKIQEHNIAFRGEDIHVEANSTWVNIPTKSYWHPEYRYTLLIENFRVGIGFFGTQTNTGLMGVQGLSVNIGEGRGLVCISDYLLWDNRNSKPILYGKAKGSCQALVLSKRDWDQMIYNYTCSIVENSPLSLAPPYSPFRVIKVGEIEESISEK